VSDGEAGVERPREVGDGCVDEPGDDVNGEGQACVRRCDDDSGNRPTASFGRAWREGLVWNTKGATRTRIYRRPIIARMARAFFSAEVSFVEPARLHTTFKAHSRLHSSLAPQSV
jgi:hypothetical protein